MSFGHWLNSLTLLDNVVILSIFAIGGWLSHLTMKGFRKIVERTNEIALSWSNSKAISIQSLNIFIGWLGVFLKSISEIARYMDQNALMIVESTIPPGTCEKKIYPMINKIFKQRRLKRKKVLLAYTYERVMPGNNYLNSIKNYWRVLSGIDKESVYKCKRFLKEIRDLYSLWKANIMMM